MVKKIVVAEAYAFTILWIYYFIECSLFLVIALLLCLSLIKNLYYYIF